MTMPDSEKNSLAPEASGLPPILAAGTFVVDYHKVIDHFPTEGSGGRTIREETGNGGAPLNVLIDLANLGVRFPLVAAAKVAMDLDGKLILECCQRHGIDISQIEAVEDAHTGYTDVFTNPRTGRYTCFHFCGIGDTFRRSNVKLRQAKPKILFLGSLGALGAMDEFNADYGRSGAAQLLRDARKQAITTVVDIAPIDRHLKLTQFSEVLQEADYLVVKDRVSENLLDLELDSDTRFDPALARESARRFLDCGLRRGVVLQAPTAALYLGQDGEEVYQRGYFLPREKRVGAAGSEHAFCAGFLEGLYYRKDFDCCLRQGLAVSAASRRSLSSSGGVEALDACLELCRDLPQAS